tara:strand:+ start:108 stop:608 length:501 start_codon:yes stop_codon:yes gene_type:complete
MNSEFYNLPDFNKIVDLEKLANQSGSGIRYEELIGCWNLRYVWKKGTDKVDNISSSFLQILYARLQLSKLDSEAKDLGLVIQNSIRFGLFSIVFKGEAFLKGKRPVLFFSFNKVVISISKLKILEKDFEKTDTKKLPFFALIALGEDNDWLCARGKGGGLALWKRS